MTSSAQTPRWRMLAVFALIGAVIALAVVQYTRRRNTVAPHTVAPIQDGKTMDFSSGKLVVKSDPTLKQAGADLDAAVANVTFAPRGNQTTPPTK